LPAGLPAAVRAVPGILGLVVAFTAARAYTSLRLGFRAYEAQLRGSERPASSASISAVFTPGVLAWAPKIAAWGREFAIDPNLVATVMQIESCGAVGATSPSGAMGLFQVMPFHFEGQEDPYDPETNARRGLSYLSAALRLARGRVDLALAGYNGGHSAISLPPAEWPSETQRYVYWGSGILADIDAGRLPSPRLEEWQRAGGGRLCAEAPALAFAAP
jgi:soluble lytic murein transglycosylase-like protein